MVELLFLNTTLCCSLSFRMSPPGDLLPHTELRLTEDPRDGGDEEETDTSVQTYASPTDICQRGLMVFSILRCSDVLEPPAMIIVNYTDP